MPSDNLHMPYEDAFRALRADRDRWARMATEQLLYNQQLEQKIIDLENQLQAMNKAKEGTTKLPQEGKYQELAEWLEAEKTLGKDYYADAENNRSKMCRDLKNILGWTPDQNSLRKAQNCQQK